MHPRHKPTIAIDLDGCLVEQPTGAYRHRKARPGAREWVERLARNHWIIIWTARPIAAYRDTRNWLKEYKFRYDRLRFSKEKATIYIGPRDITFHDFGDLDADSEGNLFTVANRRKDDAKPEQEVSDGGTDTEEASREGEGDAEREAGGLAVLR